MAMLQQTAELSLALIRLALQHRCAVLGVGGKGLWVEHAMPTGLNELAPEVEILPASGDVAVSTHRLPGFVANQRHGVDHIACFELLALPGVATPHESKRLPIVIADPDEWMHHSGLLGAGFGELKAGFARCWIKLVVGIQHPAPGCCGGGESCITGCGETCVAAVAEELGMTEPLAFAFKPQTTLLQAVVVRGIVDNQQFNGFKRLG